MSFQLTSPHADSREMAIDADGNLVESDDGGIYKRTSPRTNTGADARGDAGRDGRGARGDADRRRAHDRLRLRNLDAETGEQECSSDR